MLYFISKFELFTKWRSRTYFKLVLISFPIDSNTKLKKNYLTKTGQIQSKIMNEYIFLLLKTIINFAKIVIFLNNLFER